MFYIDNDSGVTVMPPVSAQRSAIVRWFSEGDGNNVITWPGMDWFNIVQAELLNTLEEAGIQPDKTKLNQLALSIKAIMNRNALLKKNNLSEIKSAGASAQRTARENLDIYDASLNRKGLVQLSSATNGASETLAATPKAVKAAYDKATEADKNAEKANENANGRLAKDQNGADIPNKTKFVENIGLDDTVNKAANALPIIKKVLSVDLNTLGHIDHAGVYYQSSDVNATADKHYPIQLSGTLSMTPSAYGCQQEYTTYSTSRKFMRSLLGTWNGSGPWSPWVEVYSESHKPTPNEISAVPSAGGSVGYLDGATYYDTKAEVMPRGSGAFDGQLNSGAPFYVQNFSWTPNSGGHYVPLVKGRSIRIGQGWPSAVSFGYLLPGGDRGFARPIIHVIGDGINRIWMFDPATGAINISGVGNVATEAYAQNRANEAREQAKTWAYQNMVSDIRMGANQSGIVWGGGGGTLPAGYVLTGGNFDDNCEWPVYAPIQKYINGLWYNVGRA
ncbi:TPA: tail fiber protein [Escherichia coli]|nr:tail fiber protein [Escherichia coli]HDK0693175.1 tail fiber protein [Escherichia coli]